jgi:hypothetical protein
MEQITHGNEPGAFIGGERLGAARARIRRAAVMPTRITSLPAA